ncbi:MAG: hypothetical protein ACK2TT_11450 [Anaerolineales bacterium]
MPEGNEGPQEVKEVPQESKEVAEAKQELDRATLEPAAAVEKAADIKTAEAVDAAVKEVVEAAVSADSGEGTSPPPEDSRDPVSPTYGNEESDDSDHPTSADFDTANQQNNDPGTAGWGSHPEGESPAASENDGSPLIEIETERLVGEQDSSVGAARESDSPGLDLETGIETDNEDNREDLSEAWSQTDDSAAMTPAETEIQEKAQQEAPPSTDAVQYVSDGAAPAGTGLPKEAAQDLTGSEPSAGSDPVIAESIPTASAIADELGGTGTETQGEGEGDQTSISQSAEQLVLDPEQIVDQEGGNETDSQASRTDPSTLSQELDQLAQATLGDTNAPSVVVIDSSPEAEYRPEEGEPELYDVPLSMEPDFASVEDAILDQRITDTHSEDIQEEIHEKYLDRMREYVSILTGLFNTLSDEIDAWPENEAHQVTLQVPHREGKYPFTSYSFSTVTVTSLEEAKDLRHQINQEIATIELKVLNPPPPPGLNYPGPGGTY